MSEKYISLDNLKEYNKQMQETYIKPLESKVSDLVDDYTALTFNFQEGDSKLIALTRLDKTLLTKIDWGDGTIETNFETMMQEKYHTYAEAGEYVCKIYGTTPFSAPVRVTTAAKFAKTITTIGDYTFNGCSRLTNVIIPDSVTTIGQWAFSGCNSLTNIIIPDSVTSMGYQAFSNCSNLTKVEIGSGVSSGFSVFPNCNNITTLIFKSTTPWTYPRSSFYLDPIENIFVPYGCAQAYREEWLKDNYESYPISEEILNRIIELDREAMMSDLPKVAAEVIQPIIEKNNTQDDKLAELEGRIAIVTFNITETDTTITLKNLTGMTKIDWGDGVVNTELNHTYTEVGEYICKIYNVTFMGKEAFFNCYSLTRVIIPDSITIIGDDVFRGCSNLTSIIIPDSVTSIGRYAFLSCSSLTSVEIPDSVTSIDDNAFWGCGSLTSVVIPDSVTSIGVSAFYGCRSLAQITCKSTNPISYKSSWFNNCTSLTHIYVPYGCRQAYIDEWAANGAEQDILDLIIESDREAMMSDLNTLETSMQEYVQQYIADNFATLMEQYLASNSASYDEMTTSEEVTE